MDKPFVELFTVVFVANVAAVAGALVVDLLRLSLDEASLDNFCGLSMACSDDLE